MLNSNFFLHIPTTENKEGKLELQSVNISELAREGESKHVIQFDLIYSGSAKRMSFQIKKRKKNLLKKACGKTREKDEFF